MVSKNYLFIFITVFINKLLVRHNQLCKFNKKKFLKSGWFNGVAE